MKIYYILDKISKLGSILVLTSLTFIIVNTMLTITNIELNTVAMIALSIISVFTTCKISSPYEEKLED